MDLQRGADAERAAPNPGDAGAKVIHVETHGVTCDGASGTARTDQRVLFHFPSGNGEAAGVEYNAEEGRARLLRDVRMTLTRPALRRGKKDNERDSSPEEVHVKGRRLEFGRGTRTMHVSGPGEAEARRQTLSAGHITLARDAGFHRRS